jgi:hypothetical protein
MRVRTVSELSAVPYEDMNSAEIEELRRKDLTILRQARATFESDGRNTYTSKLPTRSLNELRGTEYTDLNGDEIIKLQREDAEAYKALVDKFDNPEPKPLADGAAPEPVVPATRRIYRNGLPVENNVAIRFVNGHPVIQQ